MKKTAIQLLIEELEEQKKRVPVEAYQKGLDYAIQAAKRKLETEREEAQDNKQTCGFCVEVNTDSAINMGRTLSIADEQLGQCDQVNDQLREAAEKVVDYALYGGSEVNLHDAIVELKKTLK